MHAHPDSAEGLQQGRWEAAKKWGSWSSLSLPWRGENSILHVERLGMQSCPGWQDGTVQLLQLPHSFTTALILLFHCRLCGLVRKDMPRWMFLSLGVILSGSCLQHAGPYPVVAGVSGREVTTLGWSIAQGPGCRLAPSTGCLVLADDGMLGTSLLLLAVAMWFGTAHDVGLRAGQPLWWL